LLVPGVEGVEGVLVGHVVHQESADTLTEKQGCESLELLLAESVPDMQLRPLICVLYHLVLAREFDLGGRLLVFGELVVTVAISDGRFSNTLVANEDDLPGVVGSFLV